MSTSDVEMLKPSTIPSEYYLGDLPGNLQYSKDAEELIKAALLHNDNEYGNSQMNHNGFVLEYHTPENLQRLIPDTTTGNDGEWKLILVMKKVMGTSSGQIDQTNNNGPDIWLKGALLNKKTGKIALMTSTNNPTNMARAIQSRDPKWYVGHYRMSAPIIFWCELANRLT